MRPSTRPVLLLLAAALAVAAVGCVETPDSGADGAEPAAPVDPAREEARRHTNRGVAYLAQFLPGKAVEEFEQALALDGDNVAATVDLGIAHRVSSNLEEARTYLEEALRLDPDNVTAHYNLALVERISGNAEAALASFRKVAELDPDDVETRYALGLTLSQLQRYEEAVEEFDAALRLSPTHASAHYGRGRALVALGRQEEAMASIRRSQELAGGPLSTTSGQQYAEQGPHSVAIEDMPVDPPAPAPVAVRFSDVGDASGLDAVHAGGPTGADGVSWGSGAALVDLDGDGALDIYLVNASDSGDAPNRLFRNRGDGTFEEVAGAAGAADAGRGTGVTAGDYDNDGFTDLFVGNWGPNRLFRNRGDGTYEEVAGAAGVAAGDRTLGVAFVDTDHDGDLDLLVAGHDPQGGLTLHRNLGDGTFTDATAEAGLAGSPPTTSILAIDVDGDRDVDIVATGPTGSRLLLNNRDATFVDGNQERGWEVAGPRRGVLPLDLHKDGRPDLLLTGAGPAGVEVRLREPSGYERRVLAQADGWGAAALDFDLDGFVDAAVATADGLRLYRNRGRGELVDVSEAAGLSGVPAGTGRTLLAGDVDGDGDPDLLLTRAGEAPRLLRNESPPGRWLAVRLDGLHSNRSGIGARLAVRAGALWQQSLVTASGGYLGSGPIVQTFGLRGTDRVDALSVLWPGGVLQDEIDPETGTTLQVKELDRKGSSCPTLFAWNGREFTYLADFIGGGVLGLYLAPGVTYRPDPDELHLVRPAVGLRPDERGRIRLRLTDNLEEVSYVDRVALQAVDHPADTVVLPREGLRPVPPYPEASLHLMDRLIEPVAARDGDGRDWLSAIRRIDRRYPGFPLAGRLGHAVQHRLEVSFPAPPPDRRLWLWAHGTLEFSNSTPNFAAAQAGEGVLWPRLEVQGPGGDWQVLDAGMPVPMGVDKPALVDLTGRLPAGPVTLRIVTGMEIYWDRLALATEAGRGASMTVHGLEPAAAELRPLGFPVWRSPDGRLPKLFDYDDVRPLDTWKVLPGSYTRHGDVEELVRRADDLLVVMSPGDELALEFDAGGLPPVPAGWTRTWLVEGFGWVKDADIHSPASGRVEPLPFAGMEAYPPGARAYHDDAGRAEAAARYNTRVIAPADPLRRAPRASAIDAPGDIR